MAPDPPPDRIEGPDISEDQPYFLQQQKELDFFKQQIEPGEMANWYNEQFEQEGTSLEAFGGPRKKRKTAPEASGDAVRFGSSAETENVWI